jgi:hypothetical protein
MIQAFHEKRSHVEGEKWKLGTETRKSTEQNHFHIEAI